jgi:hypothetical protein
MSSAGIEPDISYQAAADLSPRPGGYWNGHVRIYLAIFQINLPQFFKVFPHEK